MKHTYPFPSKSRESYQNLREGQDYAVWQEPGFDLQAALDSITKPIVEVGGPTCDGYYFLDQHALSSKPIITNIHPHPPEAVARRPEYSQLVDAVMDGTNMPYKNASVGMFLMAGLSITSDWYTELPQEQRDAQEDQIQKEFDVARLEMGAVALKVLDPAHVKYAQRIPIYLEMRRTLVDDGLIMTDGSSINEIMILRSLGFRLLALTQVLVRPEQGWDGVYYEFVVQKMAKTS